MNSVSAQTVALSEKPLDKLRAKHQAAAKLAAESGSVPKIFRGDPTFQELVSTHDTPVNNSG